MTFAPLALVLTLSAPAHAAPPDVDLSEALEALEALDELDGLEGLKALEQLDDLPALESLEELKALGDALEGLGDVVVFEPGGDLSILDDLVVVREDGVEVAGVVDIQDGRIDIAGVVVIDGEQVTVAGITLPAQ